MEIKGSQGKGLGHAQRLPQPSAIQNGETILPRRNSGDTSDEDISRGPNLQNSFSDQSISVEDKKVIPAMDDDGVRLQQRLAPCCSLADEVNCDLNVSISICSGVGLQALYNNMDEPKMEMTWLGKQRGLRWQPMDCPPSPSWIGS